MATLADKDLGTLIRIADNDGGDGTANYEIADINNLVSGGVVLVRKNVHSESIFGSVPIYPASALDDKMASIYNGYPEKIKRIIIDATFPLEGSGNITRKVFAPTLTMMGGGANHGVIEGKALQYYDNNINRIKTYGGEATRWWLSSRGNTSNSYYVSPSGGTGSVEYPSRSYGVVPAFVIPASTRIEDSTNTDGSYNLNETSIAKTTKPKNTFVDGLNTIKFEWLYINTDGNTQKKYELQYKDASHTTWAELRTEETANTYADIPPNTFTGGTVYWRVRCTSTSNVISAWSEEASFTAQGKPPAPTVYATSSPRPEITWTGEGQLAYQIKIDNAVLHTAYSTDGQYKVKEYLADGAHIAAVRIQNEYGLWSDWGTAQFAVANTPGAPITLFAAGGEKAALAWTETDHKTYYIYRDDIPIAKTTAHTYSDQMAIGTHKYKVRGVAGDNYSMSNEVTVTLSVDAPEIAALGEMQWLRLEYSTAQNSPLGVSAYQDVAYQFYAGRRYPVAETSRQITKIYSFNAAFNDAAQAAAFEGLLGKTVIYRDQHGCLCTGPLMGFELSVDQFFRAFSCSIQQTDNNERIEYD
jgi:hypothetical protein